MPAWRTDDPVVQYLESVLAKFGVRERLLSVRSVLLIVGAERLLGLKK